MQTRESNRNRKFRQLQTDAIIDAELSLRWWRKHNNYHQYIPLVIQHNIPSHHLEAQEHTFIQHFQPKLNFPHIAPHMKQAFRGISQPARNTMPLRSGLMSIWAKLRRKHLPPTLQPLHKSPTFQRQSQVWQTICNLASNTKRRFDSTRELPRASTPAAQLYALHKLSSNLPSTHQRPATKAIGTALKKRKLPVPKSRMPATLPYLAHPNQRTDTSQYLRQRITLHKQPSHYTPPTTTVAFARHPRVQDQLHNWRKLHRTWQPQHPPPCTCKQLHNKHSNYIRGGAGKRAGVCVRGCVRARGRACVRMVCVGGWVGGWPTKTPPP